MWVRQCDFDGETDFLPPIPARIASNEEFVPPPQSAEQKEYEDRLALISDETARRQGCSRRDFLRSGSGMAAALMALNQVFGDCYEVNADEVEDPKAFEEKWPKDQFVFDVQTHHVDVSNKWYDETPTGRSPGPKGSRGPRRPSRTTKAGKSGAALLKLPRLPAPSSVATRDAGGLHQVRGRTWVSERVLISGQERRFRITGTGFWQVHPGAAQSLLDAVLAAADPKPGERTVDLYGGVGLFAAGLADRVGPTGSVVAVEADARATSDARRSLHDLDWIRFETGPVEGVLPYLTQDGGPLADGADVVVLDPPRAGAGKEVINRIAALRPRVIVYVACDPAALARDQAPAAAAGYRRAGLRAFDQFPMTHHVECVATLVPGSSTSSIDSGTQARTGADAIRTPGGIS